MEQNHKRIVFWCGSAPNHIALANKIAGSFKVSGIVVEHKDPKRKYSLKFLADKVLDRTIFSFIGKTWTSMQGHYRSLYPRLPQVETFQTNNINSEAVFEFTQNVRPDIIVVSGTSLIRKRLLSLKPSIGIINLHTGLSPFVKGGPNCTNWCLANNEPHLIGNTMMWIDANIDSGNIIATKLTAVSGCTGYLDLHLKVMEDAHELCLGTIDYLLSAAPPYASVPQSQLGKGNLYLTKMWNFRKKLALKRNLKTVFNMPPDTKTEVQTVPLLSSQFIRGQNL